jgi:hypothetical protein
MKPETQGTDSRTGSRIIDLHLHVAHAHAPPPRSPRAHDGATRTGRWRLAPDTGGWPDRIAGSAAATGHTSHSWRRFSRGLSRSHAQSLKMMVMPLAASWAREEHVSSRSLYHVDGMGYDTSTYCTVRIVSSTQTRVPTGHAEQACNASVRLVITHEQKAVPSATSMPWHTGRRTTTTDQTGTSPSPLAVSWPTLAERRRNAPTPGPRPATFGQSTSKCMRS